MFLVPSFLVNFEISSF